MKKTNSYEWVRITEDGKRAFVGITKEASRELGEVVFVELPSVGTHIESGQEVAVLESTKAATDSYAPLKGKVTQINPLVKNTPTLISKDPHGDGWLYEIELKSRQEYDLLKDYS
jgi:glycine cleavage system H protein